MISRVGETGSPTPPPERQVAKSLEHSAHNFIHQVRHPNDLSALAAAITELAQHASEAAQC